MGDFVDQVVVGVLQQYGVALLRAVSPATLTPAVADVRHLASLRWRAPHARVVHDAIETLFEILEDVGAPVPAVAELEVLADDEPQPMQWPLRAAFEAVLRDDVAALLYLLDRTALTAESTADAADARALPWLSAGDTLAQVARRFEVAWCTRLLEARQPPPKNPLHRRLKHSPAPHRRGSYSVMKLDFAKRQNDPTIQVLVHFPDEARVVGYTVVPDKKARHVVYDLAEAYQMDFEAFSLQNAAGHWLDDYKALRAGGVRSGDELWVVLKHKALHQQKHFCVRVVVVLRNGEQRTLAVSIDPYTLIRTLRAHVVERVREADAAMDFMLPIAVGKGALGGVWLDGDKTFSSYGLAECGLLQRVGDEGAAQRPLLMGTRESVRLYPMAGLREPDPRIERWLEIVAHFGDYTSGLKRTELRAALLLGVPACLRGRVWELLLFGHAFQSSGDQFEDLVDRDVANEAEDRILEQIGNDIDRTMPYHPSFRDKCGFGQVIVAVVIVEGASHRPCPPGELGTRAARVRHARSRAGLLSRHELHRRHIAGLPVARGLVPRAGSFDGSVSPALQLHHGHDWAALHADGVRRPLARRVTGPSSVDGAGERHRSQLRQRVVFDSLFVHGRIILERRCRRAHLGRVPGEWHALSFQGGADHSGHEAGRDGGGA